MRTPQCTAKAQASLVLALGEELLLAITDSSNLQRVQRFASALVKRAARNTFATPLGDDEVSEKFKGLVALWRKLAAELGYTGPVAWQVRAGFTLKQHAPLAGRCIQNFTYMKDWAFQNDEPTKEGFVFWIPRLLDSSTSKDVTAQKQLLVQVRTRLQLPAHHLASFGSAALLSALILAHFKRTGERVPIEGLWARTNTLRVSGDRLLLGFHSVGLHCDSWDDSDADDHVGAFPLGVEALGA